jgi:hypothetical protein
LHLSAPLFLRRILVASVTRESPRIPPLQWAVNVRPPHRPPERGARGRVSCLPPPRTPQRTYRTMDAPTWEGSKSPQVGRRLGAPARARSRPAMRRAPLAVSAYLSAGTMQSVGLPCLQRAPQRAPHLFCASHPAPAYAIRFPVLAAPRLVLRHLAHRGLIQSRHTSRSHRTSSHAFSRRPAPATKRSTASMGTTRHHRPYRPCTAFVLPRCISRTACGARDIDSGADADTPIASELGTSPAVSNRIS